jgi:hypothetical protein
MSDRGEEVRALAAAGMTQAMAAAAMGLTRSAVAGLANRNNVTFAGKRPEARRHRARVGERQPGVPAPEKTDPPARPLPRAAAGGGCRYITGDAKARPVGWCEKPTWLGSSWCPEHHDVVYSRAAAPPL